MVQPLIGITTHRSTTSLGVPLFSAAQAYVEAVVRAGGAPVLLPLGLDETTLEALTSRLDGILFSGGGDIEPELYGSQSHPKVDEIDYDRDRVELWLVQQVLRLKLPFLGICRGLQVINVGLGGSLYEDILEQHPSAQQHQFSPSHPRTYRAHAVQVQAGPAGAAPRRSGRRALPGGLCAIRAARLTYHACAGNRLPPFRRRWPAIR